MVTTPTHLDELHMQMQRLTQSLNILGRIIKTEPQVSHLDTCWQATTNLQATLDAMGPDPMRGVSDGSRRHL